jgi:hypothetical protein
LLYGIFAGCEDTLEGNKEARDLNLREFPANQLSGSPQLLLVMTGLFVWVSAKCGKTAVGGAIGVAHQKDTLSFVQEDGHTHLLQNKVSLEIIAG